MSSDSSLVNIGELSRPATVLVERIADAVGGYFKPYQIRRVARAEAEAGYIKALAELEISELQRRALQRFVAEESFRQENMEAITAKALPDVADTAQPEAVHSDWVAHFFEHARLISDEEMQALWARVLAGEANQPGTFSKRTVNLLATLDKDDAQQFGGLCRFGCRYPGWLPFVYDIQAEVYKSHGITFRVLTHLNDIGLIRLEPLTGFQRNGLQQKFVLPYFDRFILLEGPKEVDNSLPLGKVLLSKVGEQIATLCQIEEIPGFDEYLVQTWTSHGFKATRLGPDLQPV